jgi:hypothetical protein
VDSEEFSHPQGLTLDDLCTCKACVFDMRVADTATEQHAYLLGAQRGRQKFAAETAGPPSWARIDTDVAWHEAEYPITPEVGYFAGECPLGVFYLACINSIIGNSEAGKSWFALFVAVQEIKRGHIVVYVDYEDGKRGIFRRLKAMGVTKEEARKYFRYHNPNGPLTDEERTHLESSLTAEPGLVVFDGMTEGMGLEGLDTYKGEDVATWHARVTRDAARDGWCVVIIDHAPHSELRAIGSQHKKASISGVSYVVDTDQPIDQGVVGWLRIKVEKDRHSSVRAEAQRGKAPRLRGYLKVDDTATPMEVVLLPASRATDHEPAFQEPPRRHLEGIMDYVKTNPGCSGREINEYVTGGKDEIYAALDWLITHKHIEVTKVGTKHCHTVIMDLPSVAGDDF